MTEHTPSAEVRDTGPERLKVEIVTGGLSLVGDEPVALGGTGLGPNPYDLLCAALASCTTMTVRLYADHKAWPLDHIVVTVEHAKESGASPSDVFHRTVSFAGPLDDVQRARLLEIAGRCPVHRTLAAGARVETRVA